MHRVMTISTSCVLAVASTVAQGKEDVEAGRELADRLSGARSKVRLFASARRRQPKLSERVQ